MISPRRAGPRPLKHTGPLRPPGLPHVRLLAPPDLGHQLLARGVLEALLAPRVRLEVDEERAEWREQREALAQRRAEAEDEAETQVADLTEQLAKVSLALSTEREKQWSERAELEARIETQAEEKLFSLTTVLYMAVRLCEHEGSMALMLLLPLPSGL